MLLDFTNAPSRQTQHQAKFRDKTLKYDERPQYQTKGVDGQPVRAWCLLGDWSRTEKDSETKKEMG